MTKEKKLLNVLANLNILFIKEFLEFLGHISGYLLKLNRES